MGVGPSSTSSDLLRSLAVSCGFLRSFRGLFRAGEGLPGTPFTCRALVLNTAPCVRRWGDFPLIGKYDPGLRLRSRASRVPFYFSAPDLPGIMFGSGRSLSTWSGNATSRVVW